MALSALKVSVERHFDVFEHQIITYVVFVHICALESQLNHSAIVFSRQMFCLNYDLINYSYCELRM